MNTDQDKVASISIPLACNLPDDKLGERVDQIVTDLFATSISQLELEDGYEWHFSYSASQFQSLTQFIAAESECCPFFRFELIVEPNRGPLILRLRGDDQVKAFIESIFPAAE